MTNVALQSMRNDIAYQQADLTEQGNDTLYSKHCLTVNEEQVQLK